MARVGAHHIAQCAQGDRAGGVAVIGFVHAGGSQGQGALGDSGRGAAGAGDAVVGRVGAGQAHRRHAHRLAHARIAIGKRGAAVQGQQVAGDAVVAGAHAGRGVVHAVVHAVHPGVVHAQSALRHRQCAGRGCAYGIAQAVGHRRGCDGVCADHVIERGRNAATHRSRGIEHIAVLQIRHDKQGARQAVAIDHAGRYAYGGDGWHFAVNGIQTRAQRGGVPSGALIAAVAEAPTARAHQGGQAGAAHHRAGIERGAPVASRDQARRAADDQVAAGRCSCAACRRRNARIQHDCTGACVGGGDALADSQIAGGGGNRNRTRRGNAAGGTHRAYAQRHTIGQVQVGHAGRSQGSHRGAAKGVRPRAVEQQTACGNAGAALGGSARGGQRNGVGASGSQRRIDGYIATVNMDRAGNAGGAGYRDVRRVANFADSQAGNARDRAKTRDGPGLRRIKAGAKGLYRQGAGAGQIGA